jgi:hypothetical protein
MLQNPSLLLKGLACAAIAVAISLVFRLLVGGVFLPELAAQSFFSIVPGFVESTAVENLGPLAKYTTFVAASVINVVVIGVIPYILSRRNDLPSDRAKRAVVLIAVPYVVMAFLGISFALITQISSQPPSLAAILFGLVPPSLAFGLTAGIISTRQPPKSPVCVPEGDVKKRFSKKRRLFIKVGAGAAVGAVLLYYGVGLLFPKGAAQSSGVEAQGILSAQITPTKAFYRVDVNVFPPSVDSASWTLKVHGLVANPLNIDYNSLLARPAVEQNLTLECVSNEIGGDLMSTALWKGVKLKDVLQDANVESGAEYVVFRCSDGYDVGIPLDRGLLDGTILAYQMNGAPLPAEHGFPVRALVPGLYGMMNAKWLTEIEMVNQTYAGFWQRRGWTETALYQTESTILTPGSSPLRDKFPVPGSLTDLNGSAVPVVGVAFAGDRGISSVEVSTDGGGSWKPASVHPPLSENTWVFWDAQWNPPATGPYKLLVRATDKTGHLQTATITNPFPDGATGYHVVDVTVRNLS